MANIAKSVKYLLDNTIFICYKTEYFGDDAILISKRCAFHMRQYTAVYKSPYIHALLTYFHFPGANKVDTVLVNPDIVMKQRQHTLENQRVLTADNDFMKVTMTGYITSWSFYSNFDGPVAFLVLRPVGTVASPYS